MRRASRFGVGWVLAAFVTTGALVFIPTLPASEEECTDYEYREGIGNSCILPDGFLKIFSPDGTFMGTSHGGDALGHPGNQQIIGAPKRPECVSGAFGTYYTQLVYARASDDADQYASRVANIRDLTERANGLINDAAVYTGGYADLRIKCVGGETEVLNVVLPTGLCCDDFSSIAGDLYGLGYNDPNVHYQIFYDETGVHPTFGGQATGWGDDSLSPSNCNNGGCGPAYSILYGQTGAYQTWLHELGHNLGAVQNSAPHGTGAFHCYDGYDTMCYNDGGPNGHLYSGTYCAQQVWDCNKDDYFHRSPTAGSYLATHWNIGNAINRYLDFTVPVDTTAPTLTVQEPAPGFLYNGCLKAPAPVLSKGTYVQQGCAVVIARDHDAGLKEIRVYYNGALKATSFTGTAITTWTVTGPAFNQLVHAEAEDYQGNVAAVDVLVDVLK